MHHAADGTGLSPAPLVSSCLVPGGSQTALLLPPGSTLSRIIRLLTLVAVREGVAIRVWMRCLRDRSRALVNGTSLSQIGVLGVQRALWADRPCSQSWCEPAGLPLFFSLLPS